MVLFTKEEDIRENGTICPFGVFTSSIIFLSQKLDIFPLKRSIFGMSKGPFRGSKRTHGEFGFQDPTQPKCLQNKGKPNKTTIDRIIKIRPITAKKPKEKNQKDNGSIFTRPRVHGGSRGEGLGDLMAPSTA